MNLPDAIRTVRWMVRDTVRQALATRLVWVMLAVTAVCTLFCLSVDVSGDITPLAYEWDHPGMLPKSEADRLGADKVKADGVRVISGEARLGFGAVRVSLGRDRSDAVRLLLVWLASLVADTAGVLLALLWTAGFLPTFLEPQSATVLLAKPAPRWSVLLGKYLGVVLFVALNAALFVGCTWLALGIKTGVWFGAYWLAVPMAVVNFGVFYAVSAFLAVWTRSTVASAFGTLLFWLVCWAMNFTHHLLLTSPAEGLTPLSHAFLEIGYWVLPKPFDLSAVFHDAMRADGFGIKAAELRKLEAAGQFFPALSVLASALFAAVTLGLAAFEFEMTDY
jgi:ABC-type transport system involved in multi-copper enzyme maturation permease subunit